MSHRFREEPRDHETLDASEVVERLLKAFESSRFSRFTVTRGAGAGTLSLEVHVPCDCEGEVQLYATTVEGADGRLRLYEPLCGECRRRGDALGLE